MDDYEDDRIKRLRRPIRTCAIDDMREAVKAFSCLNETFLQSFDTVEQLLAIRKAWRGCAYDICPDEWTDRQIDEAIRGKIPRWRDVEGHMVPVYDDV